MSLLESSMEVVKLAGKIANPELVQAAMQANVEALEVSTKNLELQKQITALETQVRDLEAKLKLTGEVFREGDFVFHEGELRGCCSRCWDAERQLIHIIMMDLRDGRGVRPGCPHCKTGTHGRGQNPRMAQSQS